MKELIYESQKGGGVMKKTIFISALLVVILSLTSCTVNWFGDTAEVPWYVIAVPVLIIMVAAYAILMSKTYICSYCNAEFKVKPYQLSVMLHCNNKRYAKCPCCHRKGFFKSKR